MTESELSTEVPASYTEKNPIPCLVCGKELGHACPDDLVRDHLQYKGYVTNQPDKGTAFDTYGNFGSTVWDSLCEGEQLEIAVCDECLGARWSRTRVIATKRRVVVR